MKKLLKAITFCIGSVALVGCASDKGDDADGGNGGSAPVVKTMSLVCTTKDGVETEVVCEIAVSQVQVTQRALSFSINAYMAGSVLPEVCGAYERDPLSDPQGFNEKVETKLRSTVESSGTGWSVDSVVCEGSK